MRKIVGLLACLLVAACGAFVSQGTVDYNEAIEDETNHLLLMNILRAKDGVPTYYSDISQVRGSLQAGFSQPTLLGIASIGKWTARNTTSPTPSIQVSPSFDIAPLNTAEFTRGITEPLDISILQYYISRGMSNYLILNLFVDKIDVVKIVNNQAYVHRYYNQACSFSTPGSCATADGQPLDVDANFYREILPWLDYMIVNSYALMEPYGAPTSGAQGASRRPGQSGAGGGGGADMTLRMVAGGKYQMFKSSDRIALCVPMSAAQEEHDQQTSHIIKVAVLPSPFAHTGAEAAYRAQYREAPDQPHEFEIVGVPHTTVTGASPQIPDTLDPAACVQRVVYQPQSAADSENVIAAAGTGAAGESGTQEFTLVYLRSVDGIVTYLGTQLRVPCAERAIPFAVSKTSRGNDRLSVDYNGQTYYVASRGALYCPGKRDATDPLRRYDRSLDVLTLLNQLLNLNKKSNELPSTRAVEAVP